MAICAVCSEPCRGRCTKCGARLCYRHKPVNKRGKCQVCQTPRIPLAPAPPSVPPYYRPVSTAYYTPPEKDFEDMDKAEVIAYIQETVIWLEAKKKRERNYLDTRASRPGHRPTPTDAAYENDQPKEERLLKLLTYWYNEASK